MHYYARFSIIFDKNIFPLECVGCNAGGWKREADVIEDRGPTYMASRKEFLERIRRSLGRDLDDQPRPRRPEGLFPPLEAVLPPIPAEGAIEKFEEELRKVAGSPYRAAHTSELDDILRKIALESQAKGVVLSRNPLLAQLGLARKLASWAIDVAYWPQSGTGGPDPDAAQGFREHAFAAQVGITGVDFVLAESGSLVLTSQTEGAQLASLAPPVHIALYRRSQALATLEEVLDRLDVPRDPATPLPGRSVVFITGPSRTADIEQILIRGVHGPKEVHAILVEEPCLK